MGVVRLLPYISRKSITEGFDFCNNIDHSPRNGRVTDIAKNVFAEFFHKTFGEFCKFCGQSTRIYKIFAKRDVQHSAIFVALLSQGSIPAVGKQSSKAVRGAWLRTPTKGVRRVNIVVSDRPFCLTHRTPALSSPSGLISLLVAASSKKKILSSHILVRGRWGAI